ncbi:diflavin oxidoreductase [Flavobacterium zepuense]|nr:flavodoxin domain-containing protein [Flavobacterium zepuense]
MLSENKLQLLQQLVHNASKEEIIWAKGYLAGYLDAANVPINISVTPAAIAVKPTILYGTETGNSKKVASQLLANFKKNKVQAKAADVFQYDIAKLEKETHALFVMSTQGEGEFPQNAVAFYEKLQASKPSLSHLKYAVLGLGDTSYPLFCYAGELLDEALAQLGAQRILPLVKADVDYAEPVNHWEKSLHDHLANAVNPSTGVAVAKPSAPASNKKNYSGVITHKVVLNDRGSNKETYHIEITADDTVDYEPGDALGIFARNDAHTVNQVLAYFKEEGSRHISIKDKSQSVSNWLAERNIKGLSKRSIGQVAELLLVTYEAEKADLLDILAVAVIPAQVSIDDLIGVLLPIAPRLYSISSSAEAHDGQVHLTVTLDTFTANNTQKTGLASHFLAHYPIGTAINFYIHKNTHFRLPTNDTDIIMIGPGTGIAPFRSFLSYRDATGAGGRNWLFFGEQYFVLDFYYQTEIQEWITTAVLTKLDVAFSRDQQDKIYVQDRIRENAGQFNEWLQNGASLYICGQRHPMGTDVENTIIEVIAAARGLSPDAAREVLNELEEQGRYQKDVY